MTTEYVFLFSKQGCLKIFVYSRYLRLSIGLALMDTSLPNNKDVIMKMKAESVESRILEAFLESAPQFILQWSIIFRTGNISKIFIFSSFILRLLSMFPFLWLRLELDH